MEHMHKLDEEFFDCCYVSFSQIQGEKLVEVPMEPVHPGAQGLRRVAFRLR
jgi:hypothetical protein